MDAKNKADSSHHLPGGTVLFGRYRIDEVLGEGGFGITYKGYDMTLELCVAVKEYFPKLLVSRDTAVSNSIVCYNSGMDDPYTAGKEHFLEEARIMAKLERVSHIAKVRDYFEENNTAYIIMEYIEGKTLTDYVKEKGGRLKKDELFPLIRALFPALSMLHENGLVHKDISPDNIMLDNGSLCLIDFGNTRPDDGNATSNVYVRHGFSPLEQYVNMGQGARTDVYALAAVIYYCLTGQEPVKAVERSMSDTIVMPRQLGADLTDEEEKALLYALNVKPNRRYQSVDEFADALYGAKKKKWHRIAGIAVCLAAVLIVLIGSGIGRRSSVTVYSISDEEKIAFNAKKVFEKATHVSTAEELLSAVNDFHVKSVIVKGNITLSRSDPLSVSCPMMIEEGASVTIVPDKASEENGFGLYMDKDTFLINNGTLSIDDDTDRFLWVVNGRDYVFINNGKMEGSFYTNDSENIYIINYGTMEMIKFTGLKHGNWWNFGTVEMKPVLEGHGIELQGNSKVYNAGTMKFYNSFLIVRSSEKMINTADGCLEFYGSSFKGRDIVENEGEIICDKDSKVFTE